jgi:NAD(P)-dependent dehydrogenase (short-subunit alcohol dehydrogenase family)
VFGALRGGGGYPASKATIVGLTRAIAADYGSYGITSSAYNPEALTAMGASGDRETLNAMFRRWHERGYLNKAELDYRCGIGGPDGIAPWIIYWRLDEADLKRWESG